MVARIGDLDVKLDEIRTSLQNLDLREQAAISRDPALLNQVVRSLLVQRIMFREAQAKKWEQQPEVRGPPPACSSGRRDRKLPRSHVAAAGELPE